MNGKAKCKILKEIRRQIAENNDIAYTVYECPHKGDCKGTCPTCEAEVAFLENELRKRQKLGKTVLVAGLAATIMATTAGCIKDQIQDFLDNNILQGLVPALDLQEEWEQPQTDMDLQDNAADAEES